MFQNNPLKKNKIFMIFNGIFHSFMYLLFVKKDSFTINEEEKETLFYLYFLNLIKKLKV